MSALAVWVDGKLHDPADPHFRADDHGIVVGDGVFETLLVIPGPAGPTAFAISRHLRRLKTSADAMGLALTHSDDELRNAIAVCLTAAPDAGVARITVTSGVGPLSSKRGGGATRTAVMVSAPPPPTEPATAVVTASGRRNERGLMVGIKSTSYAENVLALRAAHEQGASEAIFVDTQGRVSEGTGTNIFWVADGALYTPSFDTGCLAGITRELILEHLDVTEAHLAGDDFAHVEEAFLSSSIRCVQSIGSINGTALRTVDGDITRKAAAVIADLIATNPDP